MNDLFVLDILKSCFNLKISNKTYFRKKTINIECKNGEQVEITTKKIPSSSFRKNLIKYNNDFNINKYVYNHNYFLNEKTTNKLQLRNIEDCKAYVKETCNTTLNATICNDNIVFQNKVIFQVLINTKIKN